MKNFCEETSGENEQHFSQKLIVKNLMISFSLMWTGKDITQAPKFGRPKRKPELLKI